MIHKLLRFKKSFLLILIGIFFTTSYYLKDFLILLFSSISLLIFCNVFIFKLSKIKNYITIFISFLLTFSVFEIAFKIYPLLKKDDQNKLVYDIKTLKEYPIQNGFIKFKQFDYTPGSFRLIAKTREDEIVFNVVININKNQLRHNPNNNNNNNRQINIFGASHIFGWGLNDNETLPYYLGKKFKKTNVYNISRGGWGINAGIFILENEKKLKGDINILAVGENESRLINCINHYTTGQPRYILRGEKLIHKGYCNPFYGNKILNKSFFLTFIRKKYLSLLSNDQNLKIKLIEKFINISKEKDQIPIIAMWDGSELNYNSEHLNLVNININYESLNKIDQKKYIIHEKDEHPTALANSLKAELIYKYIKKKRYLKIND